MYATHLSSPHARFHFYTSTSFLSFLLFHLLPSQFRILTVDGWMDRDLTKVSLLSCHEEILVNVSHLHVSYTKRYHFSPPHHIHTFISTHAARLQTLWDSSQMEPKSGTQLPNHPMHVPRLTFELVKKHAFFSA